MFFAKTVRVCVFAVRVFLPLVAGRVVSHVYPSFTMLSFRRFNEELALSDLELANIEIRKFHGQNDEFIGWFS